MEEIIQKYLSKSLTETEKADFESQIEKNAELREDVNFQKSISDALHVRERHILKDKLREIDKEEAVGRTSNKRSGVIQIMSSNLFRYGIAASFMIISGFLIKMFVFDQADKSDLFTQYYAPFPNVVSPSTRGDVSDEISVEEVNAFAAYESEDYGKAIGLFNGLQQKDEVVLYIGLSYLAMNDAQKAKQVLSSSAFRNDQFHLETIRLWYLALAHLKLGEIELCREVLTDLTKTENIQRTKALDLLSKL